MYSSQYSIPHPEQNEIPCISIGNGILCVREIFVRLNSLEEEDV